jgi:hypothetical protein
MIKKMIEEFGGEVTLASREGRGTTVTLHFAPILAGEEERPAGGIPRTGGDETAWPPAPMPPARVPRGSSPSGPGSSWPSWPSWA